RFSCVPLLFALRLSCRPATRCSRRSGSRRCRPAPWPGRGGWLLSRCFRRPLGSWRLGRGCRRSLAGCPARPGRCLDLCLGGRRRLASFQDVADRQAGERLAVSATPAVTGLVLVLEDHHFGVATLVQDLCHHASALHQRLAGQNAAVVGEHEHVGHLDGGADLRGQLLHLDDLLWLDAVLLTATTNYCVNGFSSRRRTLTILSMGVSCVKDRTAGVRNGGRGQAACCRRPG